MSYVCHPLDAANSKTSTISLDLQGIKPVLYMVSPEYNLLLLVQASIVLVVSVHLLNESISCCLRSLNSFPSFFVKKVLPRRIRLGARLETSCMKPGFSTLLMGKTSTMIKFCCKTYKYEQ